MKIKQSNSEYKVSEAIFMKHHTIYHHKVADDRTPVCIIADAADLVEDGINCPQTAIREASARTMAACKSSPACDSWQPRVLLECPRQSLSSTVCVVCLGM